MGVEGVLRKRMGMGIGEEEVERPGELDVIEMSDGWEMEEGMKVGAR